MPSKKDEHILSKIESYIIREMLSSLSLSEIILYNQVYGTQFIINDGKIIDII